MTFCEGTIYLHWHISLPNPRGHPRSPSTTVVHVLAYTAQLHCCYLMTLWMTWWHHQVNVHVNKLTLSGNALVLRKSAQTKISKLQQAQAKLERLRRRRPSLLLANNKSEQTIPCSRLPNCVLMLYSPLKALLSKQDACTLTPKLGNPDTFRHELKSETVMARVLQHKSTSTKQ